MSSHATHAAGGGRTGRGALEPRARGRLLALTAAIIAVAVAVVVLLIGHGGGHSASAAANNSHTYGGYPSYLKGHTALPKITNGVVQSTQAAPKTEAIEGNTIDAHLTGGAQADITAVGPAFPSSVSAAVQSGKLTEGAAVPATFTVTLIASHGSVPLSATAFSILTTGGQLVHPAVTVDGRGALPSSLASGRHITLTLRSKLVEGDGSVRWAPSGAKVMAGWLYQLELD